jgi:hypothetical protein
MANDSKKLILARRARFVAAALASVTGTATLAAGVDACGGETSQIPNEDRKDASPQPCLSPTANPQPCLEPLPPDAGAGDASVKDATSDAKLDGSKPPQPCLSLPFDAGDF